MKILLIRGPNNKKSIDLSHYTFSEPRGLQLLSSFFSEKHEVEIFDMMVEKNSIEDKINEEDYDLCGISSSCNDIFIIKNLAKKIKKTKNIPIFIGGFQVKKTPKLFLSKNIDYIILETTKENLQKIMDEVEKGEQFQTDGILKNSYKTQELSNVFCDEEFQVNRDFTEKYKNNYSYFIYKPVVLLEFYKEKDIYRTLNSIKEKTIVFIDNDFFADEIKLIDFFEGLKLLNIKKRFLVYGSSDNLIKYTEYFSFFRTYGLHSIILFLDKGDVTCINLSKNLKKQGINLWVYFNLHPQFTKFDFIDLRDYIKELNPSVVTLYPLNPFYDKGLTEKYQTILIYKNEMRANRYPGYVLIKPVNMSLREYYIEILKTTLYSYRYCLLKFPIKYGFKDSLSFFWRSVSLFFKFLKIIKTS